MSTFATASPDDLLALLRPMEGELSIIVAARRGSDVTPAPHCESCTCYRPLADHAAAMTNAVALSRRIRDMGSRIQELKRTDDGPELAQARELLLTLAERMKQDVFDVIDS